MGFRDVGWDGGMLDELIGCWVRLWNIEWVGGRLGGDGWMFGGF